MFYDIFISECAKRNIKPTVAVVEMGFQKSVSTRWKKGTLPTDANIKKVADYFGVTVEHMKGQEKVNISINNEGTETAVRTLSQNEIALLANYKSLNEEGKEKLIDYSEDLVSLGKYKKHAVAQMGNETTA